MIFLVYFILESMYTVSEYDPDNIIKHLFNW